MKQQKNPAHLEGALTGFKSKPLWRTHIRNHWPVYVLGSLSVIVTDITEVMIPKILQWTIESLTKGAKDYPRLILILIGVLAFQFVGRIFWRRTLGQQTHYVAASLKSLIWNRARYLPQNRLETDLSPGELMNVATGDVGIARFAFGFTWVGTLDFVAVVTLTLVSMCFIDWQLTLMLVFFVPLLPIVLSRLSKRESQQHKEAQDSLSKLTDLAAQTVGTARLQRLTQSESFWFHRLMESARAYRKKRLSVVFTSIDFIPYTGLAPLLSFAVLLIFGTPKVISGQITVGAFVALQTYIFMIQGPLFELGNLISEWQRGFSSLNRVTKTLGESEATGLRSGGNSFLAQESVYKAKNLSFKFSDSKNPLFKDLSFNLKQGDRLGISGPIGTGKSTLVQVLAGFESRFEGELSLFGKEVKSYSHSALRSLISVVPQKPFLFADSIKNNILMSRDYTDEEIWFFLELAGLRQDVEGFPDQLNTRLGEWGVNLSGGQKQRMTLARALAAQPKILLLDDCLSAVDTVTEDKILRNLDKHLSRTTLVWIAHRNSTLRYCNYKIELGKNSTHTMRGVLREH